MTNADAGRLYVVATPIGNLGDLSERARRALESCALIAAEDTRHTGALLAHFQISTPMISLHEHNERRRADEVVARIADGADVALVSDAGTPGISDPGYDLVRGCAAAGVEVIAIPGPCALVAALSIAALPTDRFCFEGFLPARRAARRARLAELKSEPRTLVLYESPHRVRETLQDCAETFGGDWLCRKQRVGEVGGVLHGDKPRRGDQARGRGLAVRPGDQDDLPVRREQRQQAGLHAQADDPADHGPVAAAREA